MEDTRQDWGLEHGFPLGAGSVGRQSGPAGHSAFTPFFALRSARPTGAGPGGEGPNTGAGDL